MGIAGGIEFELWSRQRWPSVQVVGEQFNREAIRALYPSSIGAGDHELELTAHLLPDPDNRFDAYAVKVLVRGQHIGFLAKEIAPKYGPIFTSLLRRGLTPSTRCRIYGYEHQEWVRTDRKGRDVFESVFNADASLVLDDPHLCAPVNLPPALSHRVLPMGSALQLRGEEQHLAVLSPLVEGSGEAWVYGTLHSIVGSSKASKDVVEIRVDEQPIGSLTPAMSSHFRPVVDHLEGIGHRATARVFVKGNQLKVEASIYAKRAHELEADWLRAVPQAQTISPTSSSEAVPSAGSLTLPPNSNIIGSRPNVVIPPRPTRIVFRAPPGWPVPPEGREPEPGWSPPQDWPPPPTGWQFWGAS